VFLSDNRLHSWSSAVPVKSESNKCVGYNALIASPITGHYVQRKDDASHPHLEVGYITSSAKGKKTEP